MPAKYSGVKNSTSLFTSISFVFISVLFTNIASAQGDLFINPKRIVFDGGRRSFEISLANIGNDTARYSASFIQIRMKDDGNFEQIVLPDSGQNFAVKYLRIFPRIVTLAPKESQTVKIQINQNLKMAPGEYRSHLYFRAVPKEILATDTLATTNTKEVSVKLVPVFGITIPVIIRLGENNAKVSLSGLKFETGKDLAPAIKFRFNRTGNMSVYGDVTVQYVSATGKVTQAGYIKGVSVYTPNKLRDMKISLDNKSGINYKSGKILVTYNSFTDDKLQKLASAELVLN